MITGSRCHLRRDPALAAGIDLRFSCAPHAKHHEERRHAQSAPRNPDDQPAEPLVGERIEAPYSSSQVVSRIKDGLLERQASGRLTMLASTVSLEEIRNIPLAYQSSHLREYNTMVKIGGVASLTDNRDSTALLTLLPDENDARLLTQCQKAGVRVFLTLDEKTILNRASQVEAVCGVVPQKPSDYFSTTLKST